MLYIYIYIYILYLYNIIYNYTYFKIIGGLVIDPLITLGEIWAK